MNIFKTNINNVVDYVKDIMSRQEEACIYAVSDDNYVATGSNGDTNLEKMYDLGIKKVPIIHEGGTIVLSPGDVEVGIFTYDYRGQKIRDNILQDIVSLCRQKGHQAILSGNDIMVNGKKVGGSGSRFFGKMLFTTIQVSVGINLELIKEICTKPMIKVPDGLSNYGITTEEILDILYRNIENN